MIKMKHDNVDDMLVTWCVCVFSLVEQIDKVFMAASKQKAWDHFSKAQRKNLELWRKQCQVTILLLYTHTM